METPDSITVDEDDDLTVVRLRGEIDSSLAPQAWGATHQALDRRRPVVLDLEQVTFMDSTGVTFLLQCHHACLRAGLPCELAHVPDRVLVVLSTLGLLDVLLVRVAAPGTTG